MENSTNQNKKFDRKTHVISKLNGRDSPPDIKKVIYEKQDKMEH